MNLFWRSTLTFYFTIGILGNYASEVNFVRKAPGIQYVKSWRTDISISSKKDFYVNAFQNIVIPEGEQTLAHNADIFFTASLPSTKAKESEGTKTRKKRTHKNITSNVLAHSTTTNSKIQNSKTYTAYTDYLLTQPDSIQALLQYAFQYKGIRYRLGGSSTAGFDCSGFAKFVFSNLGVDLPRTSHSQSFIGREIPLDSAQAGDLIFFGRKKNNSYFSTHTSIVVSNTNGILRVVHAVRGGIKEENVFDYNYYRKRVLFVKRILE